MLAPKDSDQGKKSRRASLAHLRDIKSKIGLWEQSVKVQPEASRPQKENAAPGQSFRDAAFKAFSRMPWSASKPPRRPDPPQGAAAGALANGKSGQQPGSSAYQMLAAEAAAVGKLKLDSTRLEDDHTLLGPAPGAAFASHEAEPHTPASVADTDWHDTCEIQEALKDCGNIDARRQSTTSNLEARFMAEATPAASVHPAAKTPYSAFGVAPMDISPMLSVPGTPTEYTQFSELAPEYLVCNSNSLFSPCPDTAATRDTFSNGPRLSRLSLCTTAAAENFQPPLELRFNAPSQLSSQPADQPNLTSSQEAVNKQSTEPQEEQETLLLEDLPDSDHYADADSSSGRNEDDSDFCGGLPRPVDGAPGIGGISDVFCEGRESPLWQPSFADEWKKLVDMTEPLPRFIQPIAEEPLEMDPEIKALIENALNSSSNGRSLGSLENFYRIFGPLLKSFQEGTKVAAEREALAAESAQRQEAQILKLQAEADDMRGQLCNKEAQITEYRMAVELERGERELAESEAAAAQWDLENKASKEKQKYIEQKEQFTILHRDKYLPLKQFSAGLSATVAQLEKDLQARDEQLKQLEKDVEAKARQLKFKDVAVADAVKAAQSSSEELRHKEAAMSNYQDKIQALQSELEAKDLQLQESEETKAAAEKLAKARLEEVEKLADDRQKLYKLCDELLSEAEGQKR